MSAVEPAAFASLYYTDCRPGEGLGGGAGFQFQARSEGTDAEAERVVARGALYEVPTRWMRERREVEDYPASLAHVDDGGLYVTAAGRYLGKEANGHRDGNQFTHAVATGDPASYGLVRPAQLWSAGWWADAPAPTTVCPPVPAPPESGQWETERVRDHVNASPDGPARLRALASALATTGHGPRVLVIADDGAEAACWIAAATLLVDLQEALRISFKIFVTDPDRSPHDVVVAHPDLLERRPAGYLVFDLLTGEVPDVATTAGAGFWVPRFLAGDPFDVVDAVELAGALDRAADVPSGGVARDLAALACGLVDDLAPVTARRSVRWLETAGSAVADILGPETVSVVSRAAGDAASLRSADAVTAERAAAEADPAWTASALAVRERLFDLEVDRAAAHATVEVTTPLRALGLGATELAARRDVLAGLAPRSGPLAAVLLAERHGVEPTDAMVRDLVSWWVDHPSADVEHASWACGRRVLELLPRELDLRLGDEHRAAATERDVAQRWWRRPTPLYRTVPVLGRVAPDGVSHLDVVVVRAAFAHGGEERVTALARLAAAVTPRDAAHDPWDATWLIVLGPEPVSTRETRRFLAAVPPDAVPRALAERAYGSLRRAAVFDDDAEAALAVLEKAKLPPSAFGITDWPPADPGVAAVIARVRDIALDEAAELGGYLRTTKRPRREDQRELVEALLEASPSVAGRVVLHAGRTSYRDRLLVPDLQRLAAGNRAHRPDPRALAALFVYGVKAHRDAPREARRLLEGLEQAAVDVGSSGRRRVTERLGEVPDDGVVPSWRDWLRAWRLDGAEEEAPPAPSPPAEGGRARLGGLADRVLGRRKH